MPEGPARSVAVYVDATTFGGAEHVALTLLRNLDRSRFVPTLVHTGTDGLATMVADAARAGIPDLAVEPMPDGALGARRAVRFARLLRAKRFDVFHAQLPWPLRSKYALAAAVAARVPAVLATAHCVDPDVSMTPGTALQQRLLGRRVDCYIAVSQYVADKLRAQLPWPPERIVVINNGSDLRVDARRADVRSARDAPRATAPSGRARVGPSGSA